MKQRLFPVSTPGHRLQVIQAEYALKRSQDRVRRLVGADLDPQVASLALVNGILSLIFLTIIQAPVVRPRCRATP